MAPQPNRHLSVTAVALGLVFLLALVGVLAFAIQWMKQRHGHGSGGSIYADNNASTPVFPAALEAILVATRDCYANPSSIHAAGQKCRAVIEQQREVLARLVGADACEIVFTSGATESNNIVIRGVCTQEAGNHRTRIVTTPVEHVSIYQTAESVEGMEVAHVRVDQYGKVDEQHFATLVDPQHTALVCIIMGNNEIGTIQDVRRLAGICQSRGVHFHCDMTQVFGKYRVDLHALGVDSATMSAHKFHGPKGVGALYIRKGVTVNNTCMTGGGQESTRRGGTENVGGICGMVTALQKCSERIMLGDDLRVRQMRDYVWQRLSTSIRGIRLNGHPTDCLYNTLSVCLPVNSRTLIPILDKHKIYVNTGCACSKGESSKALRAIGLTDDQMDGSLRISLGYLNTRADCVTLCDRIIQATHDLQQQRAAAA